MKREWFRAVRCLAAGASISGAAHGSPSGPASDAQPGLHRVAIAERAEPAIAVTAGYGFTEALSTDDGAHHRLALKLAGAFAALPWLNVGPSLDARYDLHAEDSGAVIDPALSARAVAALRDLRLGVELRGWAPGAESAASTFEALSLDARMLAGAVLDSARLAAAAGYRFDRSARAGENASRLGFGDRVALGLSDFDAVLLATGAGIGLGDT